MLFISAFLLPVSTAFAVTNEDFSTYTLLGSDLEATASTVTIDGLSNSEDAYVYRDYGANFFNGDFVHQFEFELTSATVNAPLIGVWALMNTVASLGTYIPINDYLAVGVLYATGDILRIYIAESDSGTAYGVSTTRDIALNTTYYANVYRLEGVGTYGTLYLDLFSNEDRTAQVGATLPLPLHSKKDFRYVYGVNSYNSASGDTVSGYVKNLALSAEFATPEVTTNIVTTSGDNLTFSGNITDVGMSDVTDWGIYVRNVSEITDNGSEGSPFEFEGTISGAGIGLIAGNWYMYQAYAKNTQGYGYGSEEWFQFAGEPTVETLYSSIGTDKAMWLWGSVENAGDLIQYQYGFEWGTDSENFTESSMARVWTLDESGKVFLSILSPNFFEQNETYYYRAYATNTYGTGYGEEMSFVYDPMLYNVTSVSEHLLLSASGNYSAEFTVLVEPATSLLNVGVMLADNINFTDNITCYMIGATNTMYHLNTWDRVSTNLGQLLPDTTYYWQGYATINGTDYFGDVVQFTTPSGLESLPTKPLIELISITDVSGSYADSSFVFKPTVKITKFTDNVTGEITSDAINYYGIQWSDTSSFLSLYKQLASSIQPDGTFALTLKFDTFMFNNSTELYNGETIYFRAYIKTTNYTEYTSNVIAFKPISDTDTGGVDTPMPTIDISEFVKQTKEGLGLTGIMGSWAFMGLIMLLVALVFGVATATTQGMARIAIAVAWLCTSIAVLGAFIFTGELGIWPIVILASGVVIMVMTFVSSKMSGGGQQI